MLQVQSLKKLMVAGFVMMSFKAMAKVESEEMVFIRSEMKSVTLLMQQTLAQQPTLQVHFENYNKQIQDVLQNSDLSVLRKKQMVAAINKNYQGDLFELMKLSKVSPIYMQKKGEETFKKMEAKYKRKYKWSIVDYMNFQWSAVHDYGNVQSGEDQSIRELEVVLTPPFLNAHRQTNFGGEALVDLTTGSFKATSKSYLAGGNSAEAGVGHFYQVPRGFDKMQVTAALPQTNWIVSSASVGGASGADAFSHIEVTLNGTVVCRKDYNHGSIFTVIGWASYLSGTDNVSIFCRMPAPHTGDEVVLNFYGEASTWAAVNASSTTVVRSAPRDIKVKMSNN